MTGHVGVAISTTGTRPEMLAASIAGWRAAGFEPVVITDTERRGVAATKNAGLAALDGCEHIFLSDDDAHPLYPNSINRYVDDPALHLSLSWGKHRALGTDGEGHSLWSHPRGVMLYAHRSVIERVGGMRPEFGTGGHEHPEWSRRIHHAGLTPHPYMDLEQDPRAWFFAEDMPRKGESVHQFQARKRRNTTIKRTAADKRRIQEIWTATDGLTDYVPFT